MLKKGYIQVYTGGGKGKTTAALGLTIRAVGAGLKVYFCQFLKGLNCSELKYLQSNSKSIFFERSGRNAFVKYTQHIDIKQAKMCFQRVSDAVIGGKYDVVILDEIFQAISLNIIKYKELKDLIKLKPQHVEMVLTGRNAPESIFKIADLVTEMREIKHYFKNGVKARAGIEK